MNIFKFFRNLTIFSFTKIKKKKIRSKNSVLHHHFVQKGRWRKFWNFFLTELAVFGPKLFTFLLFYSQTVCLHTHIFEKYSHFSQKMLKIPIKGWVILFCHHFYRKRHSKKSGDAMSTDWNFKGSETGNKVKFSGFQASVYFRTKIGRKFRESNRLKVKTFGEWWRYWIRKPAKVSRSVKV